MVKDRFPLRYQTKPFFVPGDLAKGLKVGDDEKALFLQEERRLCYVAMTRAQEKLYFTLARRYGERKTDAKPSQFLFELDYQTNPLMEITQVIREQQEGAEVPDNPVDTLKRKIKDQVHRAVEQMHLKTAIQRIVELEKIRSWKKEAPLRHSIRPDSSRCQQMTRHWSQHSNRNPSCWSVTTTISPHQHSKNMKIVRSATSLCMCCRCRPGPGHTFRWGLQSTP